ncbi:thioesterase II family protein [Paenibacillus sp. Dod16]|uniref:thioesterase II family protein n=1 Tax=Paenibacillus sp. Dod16 TaxID=3416392 RepID=UPI003CECC5AB
MNLFCIPYAGGSANIFLPWKRHLPEINVIPVELKGRGRRFDESVYQSVEEAVEDILSTIESDLQTDNYAIFGHSMGGILAFELYIRIKQMGKSKPAHIFFSGCKPPHLRKPEEQKTYSLPTEQLTKKIAEMGGTPQEILSNPELLDIFLPVIRADYRMIETYSYQREESLESDISILIGDQDSFSFDEACEWKKLSKGDMQIYTLEGNHFFIHHQTQNVMNIIRNRLKTIL